MEKLSKAPPWPEVIVLKSGMKVPVYPCDGVPEGVILVDGVPNFKLYIEKLQYELHMVKLCGPCPDEEQWEHIGEGIADLEDR